MTTLDNILDFTCGGDKFIRFGNSDGKYWIMPAHGMRTAINLYQPSGIKGKMVKSFLPLLHWLPPVRKAIHAEVRHCSLKEELRTLLCRVFGVEVIEFSIFEGTPSVHQKITMQLSNGKRILGYCKLSESNDIKELFEKEYRTLNLLAEKGVSDIPKALYCGTPDSAVHIFVQSTTKTSASEVIHEWNKLHEDFLGQLHEKIKQRILFEESDFFKSIASLEKHMDWLPDNVDKGIVVKVIDAIKQEYCEKEVEFSACHGDFTPWNMFVEKGRLFVFDFEYAAMSYPCDIDRYHYFTQTAVFERKWGVNEIIAFMNSKEGTWIDKNRYILYLIEIISRFTVREGKKVEGSEKELFALWVELLEEIIKEKGYTPSELKR